MQSKMCSVRLIHDQWNAFLMDDLSNPSDIRNNAVIRRRCDHYCLDIPVFLKHPLYVFCQNFSIKFIFFVKLRIKIDWIKFPHKDRIIN